MTNKAKEKKPHTQHGKLKKMSKKWTYKKTTNKTKKQKTHTHTQHRQLKKMSYTDPTKNWPKW